jgi:hypothetical protein
VEWSALTDIEGWQIVAKYVSAELAYVVQIERAEAKIGAREDITPVSCALYDDL